MKQKMLLSKQLLQACRELGCCYDDAQDGLIWCFFGKGEHWT